MALACCMPKNEGIWGLQHFLARQRGRGGGGSQAPGEGLALLSGAVSYSWVKGTVFPEKKKVSLFTGTHVRKVSAPGPHSQLTLTYSQGLLSFWFLVLFMLHVLNFVLFLRRSAPQDGERVQSLSQLFCSTSIGFVGGSRDGLMSILPRTRAQLRVLGEA